MLEKFDDWGARGPETELQSSTDEDPDDSLDSEGFEEGDLLAEEMGEETESAAVESDGGADERRTELSAGDTDEVNATPADHSLTELDHALEDVIVNAMSAADSHGFVRRLAAGVSRIARATGSAQGGTRCNEGARQSPAAAARNAAPRRAASRIYGLGACNGASCRCCNNLGMSKPMSRKPSQILPNASRKKRPTRRSTKHCPFSRAWQRMCSRCHSHVERMHRLRTPRSASCSMRRWTRCASSIRRVTREP